MTRTALFAAAAIAGFTFAADTALARPGAAAAKAAAEACARSRICRNATQRLGAWMRRKGESAADTVADNVEAVGSTIEAAGRMPSAPLKDKVETITKGDRRQP